ncbi:MAG: peptide deformylase [Elusimicrobia bacterium]|nr:peptide deformylase [Elusimicrobiota bacterium]
MIRTILTLPDPLLKKVSAPVAGITPAIRSLAADLIETMNRQKNCVGIAAPQVGELVRMVIIDASRHPKHYPSCGLRVLINPRITHFSDNESTGREGCLSVPDLTANVARSTAITVEAMTIEGTPYIIKTEGFEAVVLQHEIDHLDGLLFLDRVTSLQTDVFRRRNI